MKTFKQFISEKGFIRKVGETIGVRDYVDAVDIINKTETNPLKKKLRMDRLAKNNPLDISRVEEQYLTQKNLTTKSSF